MRKYFYLCALLAFGLEMFAEVPSGYYSSLDGKSDQSLKDALHAVIRPHTKLTYNSLWNYFPETDAYPEKVNTRTIVWDMYSDNWNNKQYYYFGGTGGLNREHSVPKSWWGSGSSTSEIQQYEAGTDIMHLYPSDGPANMAKSNYPLGVVDEVTYTNNWVKVGHPVTGQGGGVSYVFEPNDEYKGDFARTYFYMATCYQDYTWKYQYMYTNSSYLSMKPWAYNLLLEWSRNDPVSQKELDRNEAAYKIQGNRNPFIDDPELVEYIWGNKKGMTYTADHPVGDPELIAPVAGSVFNFGEVAIGGSQTMEVYFKGENLSKSLTVTLWSGNSAMFKSAVSSISATNANNGYKLKVTYTPTEVGDHTTKLNISDGGLTGSFSVILNASCLPVPTLSQLVATEASEVTASSYRANWNEAAERVDYYIVSRTVDGEYVPAVTTEDNYYDFDDLTAGTTHRYSVQSSRLGYTSVASNWITLASSGVAGVTNDYPLTVATMTGAIRFICNEAHTGVRIYNAQGQLLKMIPVVENGTEVALPLGAYLVTSDQCVTPVKVLAQ